MAAHLELAEATERLVGRTTQKELNTALHSLTGEDPSLQRLCTIAAALGQPQIIIPVVDAILEDPNYLDWVDDNAYQLHGVDQYGKPVTEFVNIAITRELGSDRTNAKWDAALHIWPEKRGEEGVHYDTAHNHIRNMGLYVNAGTIHDIPLEETQAGGRN